MSLVNSIADSREVWSFLKRELGIEIKEVTKVIFDFEVSSDRRTFDLTIQNQSTKKHITLEYEQAENLVIALCERFGFESERIVSFGLCFDFESIPVFKIEAYPINHIKREIK